MMHLTSIVIDLLLGHHPPGRHGQVSGYSPNRFLMSLSLPQTIVPLAGVTLGIFVTVDKFDVSRLNIGPLQIMVHILAQ